VQRAVKFVRHLPELGYDPIVVTGPGATESRWTPRDASLADELGEAQVVRAAGPEPAGATGWPGRLERWGRVPSAWARWWQASAEALCVEAGRDAVAIVATLSPFPGASAAVAAGRELGIPVVLDLRDPWALDEMMVYPSSLHRRLEERGMRDALRGAAAIVMNTRESARLLHERFPELRSVPVEVIPNGFDAADFDVAPAPRDDHAFRIVHTGYLHTELGSSVRKRRHVRALLGGSVKGVDILTRSHVYLLRAMAEVRSRGVEVPIELHLAGVIGASDRTGDSGVVEHGYLPHRSSVALLRSADLLFLPMQNLPPGRRASIVPGKTYEYLASGRPILASVPPGDARDLIAAAAETYLTAPDDTDAMAGIVETLVRRRAAEGATPDARRELDRLERRALTAELARVLDRVTGAERAVATRIRL
jgi:glycosyltransferase involved in cell wall biosynthesis